MSRFFRDGREDDSSDEAKSPAAADSEPTDSSDEEPTRRHGSISSSASESRFLIVRPTLPAPVDLIPTIRCLSTSPPGPLPSPLIRDILHTVPSLEVSDHSDLRETFTYRRYKADGVDIWFQAIDPETGDSLVHAIVRSGRIGALEACSFYPTCGFGRARYQQPRDRHILFMHQNMQGDNGLHVAARTGGLPLVRAVLRNFKGRDTLNGVLRPDMRPYAPLTCPLLFPPIIRHSYTIYSKRLYATSDSTILERRS
ncbi:uncharacterized protein F5Z01DRAFT_660663 [Emericellopsis atlantica]|uniref:Uncharacterized protein n=1 Tax=Emericellopsis atlantica TaxID=2614577 RepID=A0A9P7ZIX2_9HYPO|nr:uncharacterized protein F5Z01DRAFT_660663 [Emericellopsis atlantica]KAG9252425.1 hypothetical protein F5Z01DRAFT_660663 [Emericellopsis atlantica]